MYFNNRNEKIIFTDNSGIAPAEQGMLTCLLAGITYPNPDYRIVRSHSPEYVFEYVISGKGHIEYADRTIDVCAGSFYYIKKEVDVLYYADKNEPYEKIWVNVTGKMIERLTDIFMLGEVYTSEADVMRMFLEIHDKLEHFEASSASEINREISCLIYEILTVARKSEFFPDNRNNDSLDERIRVYLDSNVYNDISLDSTAEYFGITKMHVIRLFKRRFGITPIQYLIDKKISIAKSLLKGTVMPVGEIATLLRYSNTQHFSSSFKSAVGMTPNRYRKSNSMR